MMSECKEGGVNTRAETERERERKRERTLEEDLEYTTSFFVDQTGDTLDTSTTSETTNRRLGDTLNVVTQLLKEGKEV